MKYTAFISHSNKDAKALHMVREHLESCGYACFASERDLMHNAGWQAQLVEAMDASDMLVYLHSRNANASAEVGREINYFADKCHRPILVYRLDDVAYNRDRAYYLQSINYIDSLSDPSEGLGQLEENVRHTLEGQSLLKQGGAAAKPGRLLRKMLVPALAVVVLLGCGLGFHSWEKKKVRTLQEQGAGILSRVDGWLAGEDSLEFVLPAIDDAEDLYSRSDGFLTVKAPDAPDFTEIRGSIIQTMNDIRTRRINTVKALYEPMKYASRENGSASTGPIRVNIEKIHVLDSLLGTQGDEEIEQILNKL